MSNYAIAYGNADKIDALRAALSASAPASEIIHEVVSDQLVQLCWGQRALLSGQSK